MSSKKQWDAQGFWAGLSRCVAARGWTWEAVRKATGVSGDTMSRLRDGHRPDAASLAALSIWSGLNPAQFALEEPPAPPVRFGANSLADAICRMVDARVQGDSAQYTAHETAMREQLQALERELGQAGKEVRFR